MGGIRPECLGMVADGSVLSARIRVSRPAAGRVSHVVNACGALLCSAAINVEDGASNKPRIATFRARDRGFGLGTARRFIPQKW